MNAELAEIIAHAPEIVRETVARGECSAPVFTPPLTDRRIFTLRCHANGLTSRGTPLRDKSGVSCVPARIVIFLEEFLKVQEAPFTIDEFRNWLGRSGLNLVRVTVKMYLARLCRANKLAQVVRGVHGTPAQYQGISQKEVAA
jgi:hypothetical protein